MKLIARSAIPGTVSFAVALASTANAPPTNTTNTDSEIEMTLQIKMPTWHPTPTVQLLPCEGSLSFEGWRRDCYAECAAHFDASADGESEYGDRSIAYSPYPNALISSVAFIAGADPVDRWQHVQTYGTSRLVQTVVLVRVPDLLDGGGIGADGWIVLRHDDSEGVFTAHLTRTADDARSLFATAVAEFHDEDDELDGDDEFDGDDGV